METQEKTQETEEIIVPERLYGNVTPEQYKQWATEHEGGFFTIESEVEPGKWIGAYLKYPDREVLGRANIFFSKDDLMSCGQALVSSTAWLGGDEIIKQQAEPADIRTRRAVNQCLMMCFAVITATDQKAQFTKK